MIVYKNNPPKSSYCFDIKKCLLICILCSIPQPFGHWGPVSCKTVFPWTGENGDGLGMIQVLFIYCALCFYCYFISSNQIFTIRSQRFGLLIKRDSLICWSSNVWYIKLNFSPLCLLPGIYKWE